MESSPRCAFQTELLPLFPPHLASVETLKKAQASMMSESRIIAVAKPGTNPGWPALGKLAEKLRGRPGIKNAQVGLGAKGSPAEWLAGMIAALPAPRFAEIRKALVARHGRGPPARHARRDGGRGG